MINGLTSKVSGLALTQLRVALLEDTSRQLEVSFVLLNDDDMAVASNNEAVLFMSPEIEAAVDVLFSILEQELAEGLFVGIASGEQDPELMADTSGFFPDEEETVAPQEE